MDNAKGHDKARWRLWHSVCLIAILMVLAFVCWHYLVGWPIGYTSDTALIGLMAKHIAEQGELPLFVWSVGYQGLLLDGYLTALMFKVFGVSPVVLSLAPTIYLWLALGLWTYIATRYISPGVALAALFLVTLSTPLFYHMHLRTMPNFPEALLIGGLVLLFFLRAVEAYDKGQLRPLRPLFFGGLASGFGFYTFALSGYFVFTAILCSGFVLWRPISMARVKESLWLGLRPWLDNGTVKGIGTSTSWAKALGMMAWLLIATGGLLVFVAPKTFVWFGQVEKSNPLQIVAGGLILLVSISTPKALRSLRSRHPKILESFAILACGFLIGYGPALFFKFILGGSSKKSVAIFGRWSDLIRRATYLRDFHMDYFHGGVMPFLPFLAGCLWLVSLVIYGRMAVQKILAYLTGQESRFPVEIFLVVFMMVVFALFLVAKMTTDVWSIRYLVPLIPVYATMVATAAREAWTRWPRTRAFVAASLITTGVLGGRHIQRDLSDPSPPDATNLYERIQTKMHENKLKYAYADYWLSYATTFLANEEVILEPIYSNYCPYYGPMVKQQQQVAYVDFQPSRLQKDANGILTIDGQGYRAIKEEDIGQNVRFIVLQQEAHVGRP